MTTQSDLDALQAAYMSTQTNLVALQAALSQLQTQLDTVGTVLAALAADINSPTPPPVPIPPALVLGTIPNQAWTVGEAITPITVPVSGGTPPYSITSDTLPPGVSILVAADFVTIHGTPTTEGTSQVTINVHDSGPQVGSIDFSAAVSNPPVTNVAKIYMGMWPAGFPPATFMARFGGVEAGTLWHAYGWGTSWAQIQSAQAALLTEFETWTGPSMLDMVVALNGQAGFGSPGASPGTGTESYSSEALTMLQATAQSALKSKTQFIRMLWEFNISTTAPAFNTYDAAEFVAWYEYVWKIFSAEAVAAGKSEDWFKLVWNPNGAWAPANLAEVTAYLPAYPYVSVIGPDYYAGRWPYESADPQYPEGGEVFTNIEVTSAQWLTLAKDGGYSLMIPEWGISTGANAPNPQDDVNFIEVVWAWAEAAVAQGTNVFLNLWGGGSGEDTQENSWDITTFPNSAAKLSSLVAAGLASGLVASTNPTT